MPDQSEQEKNPQIYRIWLVLFSFHCKQMLFNCDRQFVVSINNIMCFITSLSVSNLKNVLRWIRWTGQLWCVFHGRFQSCQFANLVPQLRSWVSCLKFSRRRGDWLIHAAPPFPCRWMDPYCPMKSRRGPSESFCKHHHCSIPARNCRRQSLDGSEEQWRAPSSFESNRLSPHNRLVCGRTLWNRNAPTLPALAQVPQGPCQFGNERTAAFHWNWVPSPRQTKIRLVKSKRSTRLDILALFYFPNKAWRINLRNCNLFFRIVYKSCPFSVDVELGYWMRMVSAGCCFHNQVRPLLLRTNQVQN